MSTYKLIKLFGVDFENKGFYDLEKDDSNDDIIRVWNFKDIEIVFETAYNNG